MALRSWIGDHTLPVFCLAAFGWTWLWDAVFFVFDLRNAVPVSIPRVWGPAIAAGIGIWSSDVPVRTWLRRRLDRRVPPAFLVIAVLVPIFITNVQPVVESLGGGTIV